MFASEVAVRAGERPERVVSVLERGFEEGGLFLKSCRDDGCLERFLVGEVFIDRGRSDAEALSDPAHRERFDAFFLQELPGGIDDFAGARSELVRGAGSHR